MTALSIAGVGALAMAPLGSGAGAAQADAITRGRTYAVLSQTHRCYDGKLLRELSELCKGGSAIQKKARDYLPQLVNENSTRYEERCTVAAYQGFLGEIIHQFATDLFSQQLQITPAKDTKDPDAKAELPDKDFYPAFAEDADLAGNPFADVMHDGLVAALLKPWGLIQIDARAADPSAPLPQTKADESSQGLDRIYAYELPAEQLTNWKRDKFGAFVWAFVHQVDTDQENPFEPRGFTTETWTIWTIGEGGLAEWERYRIRYKDTDPPQPETIVPRDDGDTTQFHGIPIYPLELPEGLQIGDILASLQKEHWQRRSTLVAAQNASLVSIPYVALGVQANPTGGAIPAEIAQDQDRGTDPKSQFDERGFLTLSSDDKVGYMEPSGACYEITDKQLGELKEAMFQIAHQMALSVKPTASAVGRSGLSKQKDGDSTAKVLGALGHAVRICAVRIYKGIAAARGEPTNWTAHGLDTFENDSDRTELVEEAAGLPQIFAWCKSLTARKALAFAVLKRLLAGLDPDTYDIIRKELEEGMTAEDAMNLEADEAEHDASVAKNNAIAKDPIPKPVIAAPGIKGPAAPKAPAPKAPAPPGAKK